MSRFTQAIIIAAVIAVCLCNTHLNIKYRDFMEGKGTFDMNLARKMYAEYKSATEKSTYRFGVFVDTLKEIREHNAGSHSWKQGVNDYSDITFEEFK